ncbi:MAG: hypothetical protein HC892_08615 [Saprospiraceae bacterium]|nr:hypothetical protein [Saprospiraceae bacterium]
MRKSSYVVLVFMFSLIFVGCERNEVAPTSTESFKSIQLLQDTPDWVKELAVYAIDNEQPLEARNEQLNVYRYLTFKPELRLFLQAVDKIPGLSLLLKNQLLPVTVFAPVNEAFIAFLAENGFASLDEVPLDVLSRVLSNHIILGKKDIEWLDEYMKTLAYADCNVRGRLSIYVDVIDPRNAIVNGDVNVIKGNQIVGAGFVHWVDKVIGLSTVLDFALNDPNFSILVEALTCPTLSTDFVGALSGDGPFTIFAPTNQAFQNLFAALGVTSVCEIPAETLETVLKYHVKPGASIVASMLAREKNYTLWRKDYFCSQNWTVQQLKLWLITALRK